MRMIQGPTMNDINNAVIVAAADLNVTY
jgi:hypothetical protein